MSGEGDHCGTHCLECECEDYSHLVQCDMKDGTFYQFYLDMDEGNIDIIYHAFITEDVVHLKDDTHWIWLPSDEIRMLRIIKL